MPYLEIGVLSDAELPRFQCFDKSNQSHHLTTTRLLWLEWHLKLTIAVTLHARLGLIKLCQRK